MKPEWPLRNVVPIDGLGTPSRRSEWPRLGPFSWAVRWFGSDGKRFSRSFRSRKEAERYAERSSAVTSINRSYACVSSQDRLQRPVDYGQAMKKWSRIGPVKWEHLTSCDDSGDRKSLITKHLRIRGDWIRTSDLFTPSSDDHPSRHPKNAETLFRAHNRAAGQGQNRTDPDSVAVWVVAYWSRVSGMILRPPRQLSRCAGKARIVWSVGRECAEGCWIPARVARRSASRGCPGDDRHLFPATARA